MVEQARIGRERATGAGIVLETRHPAQSALHDHRHRRS
jgi:hypothetical protein